MSEFVMVNREFVDFVAECLERCQDQAFQSCECEECPQCGKMPDECTGTECAKTCQCSTCEHCVNEEAITELRALLGNHIVEAEGMVADGTLTDEGTIPAAQHQTKLVPEGEERDRLIAYGRSCWLDEAATVCSRMAYDTYYPTGSRFKHFVPKAQEQMGNLLIKAANAIASLPDGPYDRFKARQQKKAGTSAVA